MMLGSGASSPLGRRPCTSSPGRGRPMGCQVEIVLQLLPKQSFINEVVYERETEDELGCYVLWIWCLDPDAIAKAGTLRIVEPVEPPADYFERVGNMEWPELRTEAAAMLGYPVFIHLNRVLDYSSPPGSLSHQSYESDISGVPNDEPDVEWPVRHRYSWRLGVMDGQRRSAGRRCTPAWGEA
ncbi:hypothetical protein C2845_PM11G16480 [Panicum miliaceum]|uniref:Uncharacterized protein n=1 Tax=Panicum miliaceum TaxID=4540 RepID=A0A3L6RQI1_PANMI|nr:hypothetical protein C2845_PM11G16480 [Panicum miliaceum]